MPAYAPTATTTAICRAPRPISGCPSARGRWRSRWTSIAGRLRTDVVTKGRRYVALLAPQAQPLERTAQPIGELAECFEVDRLTGNRLSFHPLAFDREHRGAPR